MDSRFEMVCPLEMRTSLQSQHLYRAASHTGTGQGRRGGKGWPRREGDFTATSDIVFSLVVETLGPWRVHSLKTLHLIASMASAYTAFCHINHFLIMWGGSYRTKPGNVEAWWHWGTSVEDWPTLNWWGCDRGGFWDAAQQSSHYSSANSHVVLTVHACFTAGTCRPVLVRPP